MSLDQKVSTWKVEDVAEWLRSLQLSNDYSKIIKEHAITGKVLLGMKKEEFNEIGIKVFGDVKTILMEREKLK
jgi:capsular polysaccharide biosynthesis protein